MPPVYSVGRGEPWKAAAAPPPVVRPRAAGPGRRRPWWLLSGLLFFLFCAGLVWVVTWWTRPKPARIVALAAGYETNLAAPHNSYGRRWAADLADRAGGKPAEFRKDVRWDAGLRGGRPKTVVVAFAAHGGADDAGAYLLPTDAAPGPAADNRLRLSAVLERLAALPASTEKVLILEAGGMPPDPLFGPPDGDFGTALEAVDFTTVPNLSVLTANGPNERAWPAETHGTTAFGHFLRTGLNGAADADADGRVTLWELHAYLAPKVEESAARTRGAVQKPRLYPPGPEGERRAKAVIVARPTGPPPADEPLPAFNPPAGLLPAWERYAARGKEYPPPVSYAPHIWRALGATLTRAEELAFARDEASTELLAKAAELEAKLDAARRVEVGDPVLAAAVFGPSPAEPAASAAVDALWTAGEADSVALSAKLIATPAVYDRILNRVTEDPARQLNRAAEVVKLLDRPGRPRPSAAHLLVMLATKMPPGVLAARSELVRTALVTCRLADSAAAVGGVGYGERVAPALADRLAKADAARAGCEDRLFATDPGKAADDYATVRSAYESILADAGRLRSAFAARDRLFAELPPLTNAADGLELLRLWEAAERLDTALDTPTDIADLARTATSLADRLDKATTAALEPGRKMLPAPPAGVTPRDGRDAIERTLAVPTLSPDQRSKLWPLLDRFTSDVATADPAAKESDGSADRRRAELAAVALGKAETRPPAVRVPLLAAEVRRLLDTDPTGDPAAVRTAFRAADRLARITPAAMPPYRTEPGVACRGLLAQELAIALADRQAGLLWAGDTPIDEPFYKLSGGRLLADVSALGPTDAVRRKLAAVRGRLDTPFRPTIAGSAPVTTTDPAPVKLDVTLAGGRLDAVPGFLTVWSEPPPGLTLVGPAVRRALPWTTTDRYSVTVAGTPGADANRTAAVPVRGLFRGWEITGQARVNLYPVPDVVAAAGSPPPQAAVSVRASADAVRRFGCGDGTVAIVLDCSGSMAAPAGRPEAESRYKQGVAAAGRILAGLPRDTLFTVWVFGQAGEGKKTITAVEQTIAKIAGPVRRDPDNAAQLTELVGKLGQYEPFNESPITRATLAARDDLLSAAGYRAVVLISDGLDNREARGGSVLDMFPGVLRTRYRDEKVALHAVGFLPQNEEEKSAADRLRDIVKGLPVPGVYTVAPDVDGLIDTLRAGLGPRLTARLDPATGGTPVELAVSPGGTADRWADAPPGGYKLYTQPTPNGPAVGLNAGDRLLLGLDVTPGGRPTVRRLTLADEYPSRPFARDDAWRVTVLRNQLRGNGLSLLVGLESTDPAARITRPADVWFDLGTDFPGLHPTGVRWRPAFDFPAPVWELTTPTWPTYPGGGGPARPTLRVWYEPVASAATATTISLAQLPTEVRVGPDTVTVERVEPALVGRSAEPGTLAVRVQHLIDRPILVRFDGLEVASAEKRIYPKAGQSVGLFRPAASADPRAARVVLVPLAAFQSSARRIEVKDLPAADPDDAVAEK